MSTGRAHIELQFFHDNEHLILIKPYVNKDVIDRKEIIEKLKKILAQKYVEGESLTYMHIIRGNIYHLIKELEND